MSQKHQLHKCTETPRRRTTELIRYSIRGIYNAKMPTNQCVEFRQLATRALFALEPLALNPTDTSWSAFSYYIDHVQVQTPHIVINHGPRVLHVHHILDHDSTMTDHSVKVQLECLHEPKSTKRHPSPWQWDLNYYMYIPPIE